MRFDVRGKLSEFSIRHTVKNGAYMKENGDIVYNDNGTETLVMNKNDIVIPGMHNVENYCTAITAVWGMVARNNKKDCTVDFWRCWSIN